MEKFFSLNWFKQKMETAVDRVLDTRIDKMIEKLADDDNQPVSNEPPYLTIKLVNDSLTVVLRDGSVVNKAVATEEHYERVKVAKTRDEIFAVIGDREVAAERYAQEKEAVRLTAIADGFKMLGQLRDFELKDGSLYLTGTSRSIPQLLVGKFTEVVGKYKNAPLDDIEDALEADEEYQSLKNFFMWCCLNPRAEVAAQLYNFLTDNSFRITKQGFFVALRNVVTLPAGKDNELVQFVSNAYNKVKAVWKKNPSAYRVVQKGGEYCLELKETPTNSIIVGDLVDLYLDLPNMAENRFTDAHTGTFDIRVGQVVNMPMEKCNWSTADCAHAGLHFTADQIHYVGCGDTSVLILINPMKVVGIGTHKGRCYEYLPIMTVPTEEATKILHDVDFDTLELDEDYAIRELEELADRAKEGFTTESKKYSYNLPSISTAEINSIVLSLNEMKKTISKRVSLVQ